MVSQRLEIPTLGEQSCAQDHTLEEAASNCPAWEDPLVTGARPDVPGEEWNLWRQVHQPAPWGSQSLARPPESYCLQDPRGNPVACEYRPEPPRHLALVSPTPPLSSPPRRPRPPPAVAPAAGPLWGQGPRDLGQPGLTSTSPEPARPSSSTRPAQAGAQGPLPPPSPAAPSPRPPWRPARAALPRSGGARRRPWRRAPGAGRRRAG